MKMNPAYEGKVSFGVWTMKLLGDLMIDFRPRMSNEDLGMTSKTTKRRLLINLHSRAYVSKKLELFMTRFDIQSLFIQSHLSWMP